MDIFVKREMVREMKYDDFTHGIKGVEFAKNIGFENMFLKENVADENFIKKR